MKGKTNASGSRSLATTDALLRVQANAGSVVTIVKGTTSLIDYGHVNIDDNSAYDYYFVIHESQFDSVTPWTITGTWQGETSTAEIIIDTPDEYDIRLWHILRLIQNGDECVYNTGGWQPRAWNTTSTKAGILPTVTPGENYVDVRVQVTGSTWVGGVYEVINDIDLTNISILHIDFEVPSVKNDGTNNCTSWMGVANRNGTHWNPSASGHANVAYQSIFSARTVLARTEKTLDVTSITGSYDIYVGLYISTGNPYMTVRIYNIWGEH